MRVLFINSIFPNLVEPTKGNFIVKNISAYPTEIEVKVIAPLPYFLDYRRVGTSSPIPFQDTINSVDRVVPVYRPRFILLPRNIVRPIIPFLEYLFIRSTVKRIYSLWKFDLIHANFASPDGIAAAMLSKHMQVPLVITEHQASLASLLNIGYLKKQILFAYRQASKVICVSAHTKRTILNSCPNLTNLEVIPNGVDFTRFQLRTKQSMPQKLIYIGYLVPHKGVQVLLHALALLNETGISPDLSIVGSGVYLAELKKLCDELALNKQVSFLGEKNAQQVAELLAEHDAMVHPSFIESFGIVLVEALASGIPVVSTLNGGAEGIITPEIGILVPTNNVPALANGIKQLIDNWESYHPMALRAYAIERFSLATVVQNTINVYKEALCLQ